MPIPTGDLAHGTARAILKGLGVLSRYGSVDRFMSGVLPEEMGLVSKTQT